MGRYLGGIPRALSDEDKSFIKLVQAGERRVTAFRLSYTNHPSVIKWNQSEPGSPDRQKAAESLKQCSQNKLQTLHIQKGLKTYAESMKRFSELSLETATDLVQNARSEKVRADLAIEGIRHEVGTPVQKVAVQEQKTVTLTFAKPTDSSKKNPEIIDVS